MTIITSKQLTGRDEVLAKLEALPIEFHMVGSRRFGNATSESDIDLFCVYTPETAQHIYKLGFYDHLRGPDDPTYNDKDCVLVLRHPSGIDVQLRQDVSRYERLCKFFDNSTNYYEYLANEPKERRSKLWSLLLDFSRYVEQAS